MARIHFVKSAQQRFATVPVIDPDTGKQKVTPVTRRNGEPKLTKAGREITRRLTQADKSQPKPPYTCDSCRKPIEVGSPYKHVTIKSGPYGGRTLRRCATCPTWRQSELTTSKMAGVYAAQEAWQDFLATDFDSEDEVQEALAQMAEEVRSVGEEYRESAEAIREGFGHDTWQSEELDQKAEELESWAQSIESAQVPDAPAEDEHADHEFEEPEECSECGDDRGDTRHGPVFSQDEQEPDLSDHHDFAPADECAQCGQPQSAHETPMDEALQDWRQAVQDISETDDCPV